MRNAANVQRIIAVIRCLSVHPSVCHTPGTLSKRLNLS